MKTALALIPILTLGLIAPIQASAASDLSIANVDSADPVAENSSLTYTVTVSNSGPDAANGVQMVDELPSQLDAITATASQGTCKSKGKKVTCDLGSIPSGGTATVTIQ